MCGGGDLLLYSSSRIFSNKTKDSEAMEKLLLHLISAAKHAGRIASYSQQGVGPSRNSREVMESWGSVFHRGRSEIHSQLQAEV